MTVRAYYSSDASAPVLTGQAGSLIAVLDACLVNGYGAKAASGWAKEFSGTNKAVYRAPSGRRFRLRVDDSAGTDARLVGYEVMTDVDTGTFPFPTSGQLSGGLYCRKSNAATADPRGWVVVATQTAFYFLPVDNSSNWATGNSYTTCCGQFFFGDFVSLLPGDVYNTVLFGAHTTGTYAGNFGRQSSLVEFSGQTGHYMARDYTGSAAGSTFITKRPVLDPSQSTIIGGYANLGPYPDPITGQMIVSPIGIYELITGSRYALRGYLPGMLAPLHETPAQQADTIDGGGDLTGKTYLLATVGYSAQTGRAFIEISDTW